MHGTEVACLFKLGHYGKTCKCFFFPRFHIPRGEGVIAWNQLPQHNFPEPARGLLFNGPTQDVSLASLCSYIFGHMIFTLFQLCFMRFSGAFLQSFSTDIFFDAGSKSEEEKIERVFFVCNWLCKRSNELSLWSMSSWCTYNIRVLTVQVTPSPKVVSGGLCS